MLSAKAGPGALPNRQSLSASPWPSGAMRASPARPAMGISSHSRPDLLTRYTLPWKLSRPSLHPRVRPGFVCAATPPKAEAIELNTPTRHAADGTPLARTSTSAGPPKMSRRVAPEVRRRPRGGLTTLLSAASKMRLPPLASRVYLWPLRALLLLLGSTLLLALSRTLWHAAFPPVTQRQRERKNQAAVLMIRETLAEGRGSLTPERANRIVRQTGFSKAAVFRKYVWWALQARAFDQSVVDDVRTLKAALGLPDSEAAEALKDRAARVFKTYGPVMLGVQGMTLAGVTRKATSKALVAKLQFLLDDRKLLSEKAAQTVDLAAMFNATQEEMQQLRMSSLEDGDGIAALPSDNYT